MIYYTGTIFEDIIPDCSFAGFVWVNDNKTFYYMKMDDAKRPCKLFRHTLGNNIEEDRLLYEETDTTFNLFPYSSMDNKYVLALSHSMNSSEIRIFDKNDPHSQFNLLWSKRTI